MYFLDSQNRISAIGSPSKRLVYPRFIALSLSFSIKWIWPHRSCRWLFSQRQRFPMCVESTLLMKKEGHDLGWGNQHRYDLLICRDCVNDNIVRIRFHVFLNTWGVTVVRPVSLARGFVVPWQDSQCRSEIQWNFWKDQPRSRGF